jgi:endonuclease YncB( thermonuclease family)
MYEYNCTIVRVVDGDTVDVDIDLGFDTWIHGERIRLYGVDTPECRSRSATEKKAGLLAKGFVIRCCTKVARTSSPRKRKESSAGTLARSR